MEHEETYEDLIRKHGYLVVDKPCPKCEGYTLERQVFGHEETIFCIQCTYTETHNV